MTASKVKRNPIVVFCLGLLASIVVCEIVVRLVEASPLWRIMPVPEVSLFQPDRFTGYAHRPGARGVWTTENRTHVAISSLGLRDRLGRTVLKPPGSTRWAIIGDSIVESLQVPLDRTFPVLAEKQLSLKAGHLVEVINMGLSGATPAVIAERLRTRGELLDLDGVVVVIGASDLRREIPDDASGFAGFVVGPDGGAQLSHAFRDSAGFRFRTGVFGSMFYWLLDHSRVALVINNRKNHGIFHELSAGQAGGARPADEVGGANAGGDPRCTAAQLARHIAFWNGTAGGFADARLTTFLSTVRDSMGRGGFNVTFAVRGLALCPRERELSSALRTAMAVRLAKFGFSFVDVRAQLRARLGKDGDLASLQGFGARIGQGHLNEAGHAAYARVIADVVGGGEAER